MSDKQLTCEDCGKQDDTVEHGICPYANEIDEVEIYVDLCEKCHHERCMDI